MTHRFDEANAAYEMSMKHIPKDDQLHFVYAGFLKQMGRIRESAAVCRQAIKLNPKATKIRRSLADLEEYAQENEAEEEGEDGVAKTSPFFATRFLSWTESSHLLATTLMRKTKSSPLFATS